MSSSRGLEPRKQPRQERSRITRDAILGATARILAEEGYGRLTTNRIAQRAGVSIGSLYQYYPNKEAVITSLVRREADKDRVHLERLFREVRDLPVGEAVRCIVGVVFDRCEEDLVLAVAMREQIPRLGGENAVCRTNEALEVVLGELLQDRYPRVGPLEIRFAAFLSVHAVDGIVSAALSEHPDWLGVPEFRALVAEMVLESFRRLEAC